MEENAMSQSTKVPVPLVDLNQLPREKGWTYTELAGIVGNLYLEAHKRSTMMEEQFNSVISEYQRQNAELQAALTKSVEDNERYRKELSRRNEQPRVNPTPSSVG